MQFESSAGGVDVSAYLDPDQALGTQGSLVRAAAIENHQRELVNLITTAGLTPDRGDLTQVAAAVAALIADAVAAATLVAPGTLRVSAAGSPAAGEFLCNGAAVSRAVYAPLFAAIGTAWGPGDGSTTFNLPDLRGRALVVAGTGTGLTARSLAAVFGAETVTLSVAELPEHSHDIIRELADSDATAGSGNGHLVGDGNESGSLVTITGDGLRGVQPTGDGDAHANVQPSVAVNVFIHV